MRTRFFSKTFTLSGDFAAARAAESFLTERGFSVASEQRGAPRGVLFGRYQIAKWRNLNRDERDLLDGTLTGDGRYGPITLTIFDDAHEDAKAAVREQVAGLPSELESANG